MPRVMTVDDQEVFRSAARAVVEATPGFESAGEPASGEEALELVEKVKPELVLVDVRMPGLGGVETARALSVHDPDLVVVLVSLDDPPTGPGTEAIPFVRKQDFGPGLLRDLWAAHGSHRRS
jgi:DNA-binding NarL/FixJ family response regulator